MNYEERMTSSRRETIRERFTFDDSAFAALASERRRTVLRCLQTADAPVAMADLARDVVARERDAHARDVPEEAIERVYVSLHHVHLPKLADEGYLRYDDNRTSVVLTDDAELLESILDQAARLTE